MIDKAVVIHEGVIISEGTVSDMNELYQKRIKEYGGVVTLYVLKERDGYQFWLDQKRHVSALRKPL